MFKLNIDFEKCGDGWENRGGMLGCPSHLINIAKSFFVYIVDNKMIESIAIFLKL